MLSRATRASLLLRVFAFVKIPMLAAVRPSVVELTDARCVTRVRLRRFTRNHLRSMYLGALAVGSEIVPGLLALDAMRGYDRQLKLIYKDFHADFLKRPDHHVYFICDQGSEIREVVRRAYETGERQNLEVTVSARTRHPDHGEEVARFALTLSLKR